MLKQFAFVAGASGAIGQEICERLAEQGWSLYLQYNQGYERVQALYKTLSTQYPQQEFMLIQADFTDDQAADYVAAQVFTIHALVFANGQAHYDMLEDTSVTMMQNLWRVHVQNPMRLSALLSAKLRANNGYIIVIGSIWGEAGASFEVAYSAVKGAQHAFVKAYAQEVAPFIKVNAILPGMIDTTMNGHLSEQEQQAIIADIPLGRLGTAHEVANMVAFYVSGQADYVTGQCIRLNGGWYI